MCHINACRMPYAVCRALFAFFARFKWISVFIFIFTRTVCKFNLFTALTATPASLPARFALHRCHLVWFDVQVHCILHKCIRVRGEILEIDDDRTIKVSCNDISCIFALLMFIVYIFKKFVRKLDFFLSNSCLIIQHSCHASKFPTFRYYICRSI